MTKKLLTFAVAIIAGLAVGIAQADDEKGKGKKPGGKGKGGDPAKRAEMMLKRADTDKDGKISKEEWGKTPMAKKINEAKGDGAADKLFGMRDKNDDGFLDKAELSAPPKRGKGKGKPGKPGEKGKGKPKKPEAKKAEGEGDKKKAE